MPSLAPLEHGPRSRVCCWLCSPPHPRDVCGASASGGHGCCFPDICCLRFQAAFPPGSPFRFLRPCLPCQAWRGNAGVVLSGAGLCRRPVPGVVGAAPPARELPLSTSAWSHPFSGCLVSGHCPVSRGGGRQAQHWPAGLEASVSRGLDRSEPGRPAGPHSACSPSPGRPERSWSHACRPRVICEVGVCVPPGSAGTPKCRSAGPSRSPGSAGRTRSPAALP